ncbi:hypothetical protein AKJ64_00170 [candidate division MSBL1 archaeon SCGC-AAA259E17]|uniref:Uncharacterized protein n=1 Tax=candidate division MSBL1 archaeon SCGC-AAA259E17 TaxID=1698263 RepID=A0A133UHP9_9EURY|nr:hypothetical protein AKJ64_00170 [candidate division MSBL1 archaeon SCGC-AAA259E17]
MKMSETIVYYDENYPSSWIWDESAKILSGYYKNKGMDRKGAEELEGWIEEKIEEDASSSAVIFAQDIVPDTILRTTQRSRLRKHLEEGK